MPVTINDVARAAGVSRATVVRALADRYGTSMETRARIKKIATEMNYRPNYIARSLAVGGACLIHGMLDCIGRLASYREISGEWRVESGEQGRDLSPF